MSIPDDAFPVNVQESVISANLNGSMLFNFLMGIYTMVYAGTMYAYISKKAANKGRRVILSTISMLYLLCMGIFVIQWEYLDLAVVTDGDTRESLFIATVEGGPSWFYALFEFLFFSVFIVSDGLLIWRCYHVWGMSIKIILVPSILFLAELGESCALLLVITVLSALHNSIATNKAVISAETGIITAQTFTSLATTVITTSLIGYKIYSASRPTGRSSKGRFTYIMTVIFESAAAYSVAILIYAITLALPSGNYLGSPVFDGDYYLQALVIAVAGMAPTILVARIALTSENNSVGQTITHISGLQFQSHRQSGHSGVSANGRENNASMQESNMAPQDEEKGLE